MSEKKWSPDEVHAEVRARIAELTELEMDEVRDDASLMDDLEVDSLMAIELMVALDKEYRIDIPEDEFEKVVTVKDVTDLILKYLSQVPEYSLSEQREGRGA